VADERRRHQLYDDLTRVLSPGSADELMTYLPPVGWAEVATKADVGTIRNEMDALRAELRGEMAEVRGDLRAEMAEMRGEMADLRAEMAEMRGDLRTEMAQGFDQMRKWMVTSMVGFTVGIGGLVIGVAQLHR
jgi:hypothetical protein